MPRVLLVGQPNVGKSTLLNSLTGARVWTSNYPGTTVDIAMASTVIDGEEYVFIDTPGIYNLYPSSIEEEVTEKAILSEDYDIVMLVVDATAIERGLVLAVALAELAPPMLVAVNFWEEAERKGLQIDYGRLEKILGVPVVRINPLRPGGLEELKRRLREARKPSFIVRYDDHIEEAVEEAMNCVPEHRLLSRRGLAVRLVEGDPLVQRMHPCPAAEEARKRLARLGHDPYRDIEATRAGEAFRIASMVVRLASEPSEALSRLDVLLLRSPVAGMLASVSVVLLLIGATVLLGSRIMSALDSLLGPLAGAAAGWAAGLGGLLGRALEASITALYAQYIAAVPYVFMFYLLVVMLEDSGVLARAVTWLYAFTRRIGLHPKAVVPVLLGMGCSVPAISATRILPSEKQRLAAVAALAFVPCSSRAAIIFGVAGASLGAWAPVTVYLLGFALGLAAAWTVARLTGAGEDALLVEDLPPLRAPRPRSVAVKAWLRLRDFLSYVTPLVVVGAVVYAVIDYYGVAGVVETVAAPVARLLELPPATMIPLVYGFVQKDLTVAMLAAVLGTSDFASALTPRQIMTFTMAATYQVPCIIAALSMAREFGWRKALVMIASLDAAGLLVAAAYARLA